MTEALPKSSHMTRTIYYLPGHGGRLETGLGEALLSRGFDVTGRQTIGEFRALPFSEQVALVAHDLTSSHWNPDAMVVANSFGAYLFLHAQTLMAPYVGRVLLLSPIVGEFSNEETRMGFIPPQAERLSELATGGSCPIPGNCEIHVGENDWQSNPANVVKLASLLGIEVTVVPKNGHMLDKAYVSAVLDRWLSLT
jgi:predicted alpha/beta hydrolase family esterase